MMREPRRHSGANCHRRFKGIPNEMKLKTGYQVEMKSECLRSTTRITNEHIQENLWVVSIGDKLRKLFEMVWTCPTHANNCTNGQKYFYAS